MNKYSEEVTKVLKCSEIEALNLKNEFIGSEHLLLAFLKIQTDIKKILNKNGLTYEKVIKNVTKYTNKCDMTFYTPTLKKIIENSLIASKDDNYEESNIVSLSLSMLDESNSKAHTLIEKENINIKSLYKEISKLLIKDNQSIITELGTDITELAKKGELDKVIGRDKEINRIIEILARKNKNNPLLIGEAGVGKTAIIEELAKRITTGNVPNILLNKKIISINIASIISGTKYRGEFEEKMNKIIKELENEKNTILFIDEIHTLVGAGGAEGAIDASNILKPALARGNAKCIGATTINEYKKSIEKDKALDRRFQKVIINEPTEQETLYILKQIKKDYEKFHNVLIPNDLLEKIPYLTKKYITDRNEPDKSIDILDEICAKTSVYKNIKDINTHRTNIKTLKKDKEKALTHKNYEQAILISKQIKKEQTKLDHLLDTSTKKKVTQTILKEVLEDKSNNRIYELEEKTNYFTELKHKLTKHIINQEESISKLINLYKIHKQKTSKIPTTILLTGPSGCGKTQLIKELAKKTNTNLLKLNMSEYKSEISINKIIGSPQGYVGYNDTNTTFEILKLKPNSIILVENIESANQNIINLFETIIDEGEITNSKNETILLNNNLIIFTTNKFENTNKVGFINTEKQNNTSTFYNKIYNKINLNKLTLKDIKKIIKNKTRNLTEDQINEIIEKSEYKTIGATKLNTLIYEVLNTTTQL